MILSSNLYKFLIILIVILGGLILLVLFAFMINFGNLGVSNNLADWAYFGDYICGILNPILALVNVCVFIILTLTIQQLADHRTKDNIETQRKNVLMTMKNEELKNFKRIMDNNLKDWRSNLHNIDHLKQVLYGYNVLEYRMLYLFPELKNSKNNATLRKYIVKALKLYEDGNNIEAAAHHIPVSNTYGMLVSDLSKWTIK